MRFEDAIELFYYAHRAVIAEPDAVLARRGLGRVHHRVLYCIQRNPDITVGRVCRVLGVTKQALHAPLAALVKKGLVARTVNPASRRERQLRLTARGSALEAQLTGAQLARLARAFREAGATAVRGWGDVMGAIADRPPRRRL